MREVGDLSGLRAAIGAWRQAGERIAFVPTMGNLHAGHMALVAQARRLGDRVVVSVFVNPTQFAPGEDYDSYPRTLAADRERLAGAGVDLLFTPDDAVMYPQGVQAGTDYRVPPEGRGLEGQFRPGFFAGVITVVRRLFELVTPDIAVFGEKDYQQLVVIRTLVKDLGLPVEIAAVPTVREADGLALSSRNQYLSHDERIAAPLLQRILADVAERVHAGDDDLRHQEVKAVEQLRASGFVPDYVSIRDAHNLQPLPAGERHGVVLAAARLGRARLIDNVVF